MLVQSALGTELDFCDWCHIGSEANVRCGYVWNHNPHRAAEDVDKHVDNFCGELTKALGIRTQNHHEAHSPSPETPWDRTAWDKAIAGEYLQSGHGTDMLSAAGADPLSSRTVLEMNRSAYQDAAVFSSSEKSERISPRRETTNYLQIWETNMDLGYPRLLSPEPAMGLPMGTTSPWVSRSLPRPIPSQSRLDSAPVPICREFPQIADA